MPAGVITRILEALKLDVEKYSTWWTERNIEACRTDQPRFPLRFAEP